MGHPLTFLEITPYIVKTTFIIFIKSFCQNKTVFRLCEPFEIGFNAFQCIKRIKDGTKI